MTVSWKMLLMEAAENQGYEKGYVDGLANGRIQGRKGGIEITQRQIANALRRENVTFAVIAKVTDLSIAVLESLLLKTE